jgi:hypothetical protein
MAINMFMVVTSVTFFIGTSFLRRAPHPDASSEANRINVFFMLVTFGFGHASGCIYLKKTRRAAEDWTFHGIQYAVLAALLWRGLRGTFNTAGKTILALSAFVVAAAFAGR